MSSSPLTPPPGGVSVRMYRQGLGDCFLLAFHREALEEGGRPYYVLIDCGVLVGTEDGREKVRRVATDLLETTGGRIDLLVATHQHWDHLSGFDQADDIFERIQFDEVWVAWTEDPHDPLACRLRRHREIGLRALGASVDQLKAAGPSEAAQVECCQAAEGLESLLGFYGERPLAGQPSAIQRAMSAVLRRGDPPRYRRPGEGPLPLRGTKDARAFVLGPPYDERMLLRSDPSRGQGEVYERRLALGEETAFFAALLGASGAPGSGEAGGTEKTADPESQWEEWELEEMRKRSFPFDAGLRLEIAEAREHKFFREFYFGAGSEREGDLLWRRIDSDWLRAAGDVALQLDSDTNNTSLALAFELSPGGKVLLFPGDAQVGNWQSWHLHRWRERHGKHAPDITAADLLRRTVLYKVGHHGSHNATLREQGLELMTHPGLVAMIPVDEAVARKPKGGSPKGWDMPFGPLLSRLEERTDGRILRVDSGKPPRPPHMTLDDWTEFDRAVTETDLYLQLEIEPGDGEG